MRRILLVIFFMIVLSCYILFSSENKNENDDSIDKTSAVDNWCDARSEAVKTDRDTEIQGSEDSDTGLDNILYSYNGHYLIRQGLVPPRKLVWDEDILTEDPWVSVMLQDSIHCVFKLVNRAKRFDMSENNVVNNIKSFMDPLAGFERLERLYLCEADDLTTLYYLTVDYPIKDFVGKENVLRWIRDMVCFFQNPNFCNQFNLSDSILKAKCTHPDRFISGVNVDVETLGSFISSGGYEIHNFRDDVDNYFLVDARAHELGNKYVTYRFYVHSFQLLGHGEYIEVLSTFDMLKDRIVDTNILFDSEGIGEVHQILLDKMIQNDDFLQWHPNVKNRNDVEDIVMNSTFYIFHDKDQHSFVLPECAITSDGIVFTFQPYEIAPFAAGAFHFLVPINQLYPYLTAEGIELVSSNVN